MAKKFNSSLNYNTLGSGTYGCVISPLIQSTTDASKIGNSNQYVTKFMSEHDAKDEVNTCDRVLVQLKANGYDASLIDSMGIFPVSIATYCNYDKMGFSSERAYRAFIMKQCHNNKFSDREEICGVQYKKYQGVLDEKRIHELFASRSLSSIMSLFDRTRTKLQFLHYAFVAHNDVKGDNLALTFSETGNNDMIQFADWGLSAYLDKSFMEVYSALMRKHYPHRESLFWHHTANDIQLNKNVIVNALLKLDPGHPVFYAFYDKYDLLFGYVRHGAPIAERLKKNLDSHEAYLDPFSRYKNTRGSSNNVQFLSSYAMCLFYSRLGQVVIRMGQMKFDEWYLKEAYAFFQDPKLIKTKKIRAIVRKYVSGLSAATLKDLQREKQFYHDVLDLANTIMVVFKDNKPRGYQICKGICSMYACFMYDNFCLEATLSRKLNNIGITELGLLRFIYVFGYIVI